MENENLETEIIDATETIEAIDKLVNNLVEWLEAYTDNFAKKEPEISEALMEPDAQTALSDSFEEILVELDEVEQWTEEDLLTVAAHSILLALTLRSDEDGIDSKAGDNARSDGDDRSDNE